MVQVGGKLNFQIGGDEAAMLPCGLDEDMGKNGLYRSPVSNVCHIGQDRQEIFAIDGDFHQVLLLECQI
jgi:hypothetical protein